MAGRRRDPPAPCRVDAPSSTWNGWRSLPEVPALPHPGCRCTFEFRCSLSGLPTRLAGFTVESACANLAMTVEEGQEQQAEDVFLIFRRIHLRPQLVCGLEEEGFQLFKCDFGSAHFVRSLKFGWPAWVHTDIGMPVFVESVAVTDPAVDTLAAQGFASNPFITLEQERVVGSIGFACS